MAVQPTLRCGVCLEICGSKEEREQGKEDWSVILTCGHVLHNVCLMNSLEHNNRCPFCMVSTSARPAERPSMLDFSQQGMPEEDSILAVDVDTQ